MFEETRQRLSTEYALGKIQILHFEVNLLSIELRMLNELAGELNRYRAEKIEPLTKDHLKYDEVFYKWSEQASRYYKQAAGIHEIFVEKAKQIQEIIEALKKDLGESEFQRLEFNELEFPNIEFEDVTEEANRLTKNAGS